ncbi:hypothetical protein C8J57DRAFT_961908, partial [Mycena rebaudengoi]
DPLIRFGAVDGKLPHRSMEESIALRDVLIRWTAPHMELQWENLPQGIRDVAALGSPLQFVSELDEVHTPRLYCISLPALIFLAHICLAVQQIMDGVSDFLNKAQHHRFVLDPQFRFLRMLERHHSRTEVCHAFVALQTRVYHAGAHIRKHLNEIQQALVGTEDDERYSSIDSTITEVRSDFLRGDTLSEMYKLFQRPVY